MAKVFRRIRARRRRENRHLAWHCHWDWQTHRYRHTGHQEHGI